MRFTGKAVTIVSKLDSFSCTQISLSANDIILLCSFFIIFRRTGNQQIRNFFFPFVERVTGDYVTNTGQITYTRKLLK